MMNSTRLLKNSIRVILCLVAATGGLIPAFAQTVIPINGTPPALTPVTINAGTGDQYDPHISGDWVAYTSDLSIRYYNFATNTDAGIPMGASSRDLLSDVSGSKIVFSRVMSGLKTAVMVFDASTPAVPPIEIDAAAGTTRIGSAIGGNTVAYIDFGLHGNGELVIHDLVSAMSVRATSDVAFDANPSVSPDGNVVTWEHCATSTTNCNIWQAVKSGAVWSVSVASDTPNPEANPASNGTLVVYDSVLGSGSTNNGELFWRPVTGGAEVQLQMVGIEANPSIAGRLICFESRPTLFATSDIFIYDITTNLLYQITDTPLVTEQLNDITFLPNGDVRVVWASDEDDFSQRNVKGATFTLAAPPCQGALAVLGTSLPASPVEDIFQGGAPNFADTYVTPYVATQAGTITSWKAEFTGGNSEAQPVIPVGIQLKVLRQVSPNTLQVISAGQVHDPRAALQTRFGGSYPFFQSTDSVLEFTDQGLNIEPGDIVGLTLKSDPAIAIYAYPLVAQVGTRLVLRDVAVGGTIDLNDPFTASLTNAPALQLNLNGCSDITPPVLDPLTNVVVTLPLNSTATSMPVTFPAPRASDDSGTVTVTTSPLSGAVFPVGITTVNVTATDPAGNVAKGTFTVTVMYNFSGFLQPVDDLPTLNLVNAGQAIPVKFSLSGNKGLNIFAAGSPSSSQIACDANEPGDVIEETVTAGGSSLTYDAGADRYSYIWKTDKAWKGTCRILALRLKDGSSHFAKFRFR
jgi:hypothetical protein